MGHQCPKQHRFGLDIDISPPITTVYRLSQGWIADLAARSARSAVKIWIAVEGLFDVEKSLLKGSPISVN